MPEPFTWEAPDDSLLEDRRGALPQFPAAIFSPGVADWLLRAAHGAGTLLDHVAVPMLGTTSSLIGKARRVQASTSWIEPMTMWTCIVGQSGDRKTPGLKVITRALDQIEKDNKPQHQSESAAHKARVERARAEFKLWKQKCQKAVKARREPPPMPIEAIDPGDFIWPSLFVADCTHPRLGKLCVVRPRGMLQIRDELSALFASFMPGTRSFYLEAWNGDKHVVERVKDDASFVVDNLLVGVIGGFQPDKLARAFSGDEDGMYARFMFGWPVTPDYSELTDEISEIDPFFQSLLTKLIRLPAENERGEFAPLTIPLSAEARQEFENHRRFVDRVKRGIEGREQQWLAKSETHTLRLAGTLAYLAWADDSSQQGGLSSISAGLEPREIDARIMVDAVRLMQNYFWPHARACLHQVGLTDRHRRIRRALRWIQAHNRHEISLKDIRREALSEIVDGEQARELLERMVSAGWLRAEPVQTGERGGRPRERWGVNPRLFEFAETAETAQSHLTAVPAISATLRTAKKHGGPT